MLMFSEFKPTSTFIPSMILSENQRFQMILRAMTEVHKLFHEGGL